MFRLAGSFLFAVLLMGLVAGCAKREDKLVKERIALFEKIAEEFEAVTDKASMDAARPKIAELEAKVRKTDEELKGLPGREAAEAANKTEFDAAMVRRGKAKTLAAKLSR
jgi:hypothetical protein